VRILALICLAKLINLMAPLVEAHRLGLARVVWTPDQAEDMKQLIDMGVDGIITNRPDILNALFKN
jgi:glycerophosphoryl diester phosphodiesterase